MNAEMLLQHFDRISEAPDAIARLRRFIFDLAVRGKLVEQNVTDESTEKLLKRIQAEKANLVTNRNAKKEKPRQPIEEVDLPFSIPASWIWVRLQDIASYIQRGKSPIYAAEDGLPVVSQKCVQWSGLDLAAARLITRDSITKYEKERLLRENDLLWNSTGTGTIGRVVRIAAPPEHLVCDSHVTVVRCMLVNAEYIRTWLRSDHVYRLIEDRAAGSTNQVELTAQMAVAQVTPLPPLAEQHRIVAKVDELMTLCDQLEAAQNYREARRDRLVAASLHRIGNATTIAGEAATEVQSNATLSEAARFHLAHLPRLTTRPEHIKQLRQTILSLAVCGRLVPQDPNDEPAADLLKQIQAEPVRLNKESVIKKQKQFPPLTNEDIPFSIPKPWAWVRLSSISDVQDPNPSHRMPHYVQSDGVPFISSENFVRGDEINFQIGKQVARQTLDEQIERFSILEGALAFTRIGTIGKSRFLPAERTYAISHAVCVINPLDRLALDMRFLRLAMSVDAVLAFAHRGTRSIGVPDLGMAVIRGMAIPFPPLAEQHRIVAKVDELMALCDQLETQLTSTEADSRRLLEAVLRDALALRALANRCLKH